MFYAFIIYTLWATTAFARPQAGPVKRQDDDFNSQVDRLISEAGLTEYKPPAAGVEIREWLAVGDSYASGIGADWKNDWIESSGDCSRFKGAYPQLMQDSDLMPGNKYSRKMTFGACQGDKVDDYTSKQLKQGDPKDEQTTPIGKPQIATLSIGGNDIGFGNIVNACILHWVGYGDCTQLLQDAWNLLEDPAKGFELKLIDTYIKTILAGVTAGGAQPVEAFQLFVTGYVRFWDETDNSCDEVYWSPYYKEAAYLKLEMRKDMNKMADKLNEVIKSAVEATSRAWGGGIYYVEGYQNAYKDHLFCRPGSDLWKPTDDDTWFFHPESPWEDRPTAQSDKSWFDQVTEALIPEKDGKSTRDQILEAGNDTARLNPAFTDIDSMTAALRQLAADNPEAYWTWPTNWLRVFHPKTTGYHMTKGNTIDTIKAKITIAASSSTDLTADCGDDLADVEKSYFEEVIRGFCRDADLGSDVSRDLTNADVDDGPANYDGYAFHFEIKNKPAECAASCEDIFMRFSGSCSYNSHALRTSGSLSQGCGDVSYSITKPPEEEEPERPAPYAEGSCSFHVRQYNYDNVFFSDQTGYAVDVRLLDDAKNEIGSAEGVPANDGGGYSLVSKLEDPLVITCESQGDYVQYTVGSTSFRSSDPNCSVGKWDYGITRDMDCSWDCSYGGGPSSDGSN